MNIIKKSFKLIQTRTFVFLSIFVIIATTVFICRNNPTKFNINPVGSQLKETIKHSAFVTALNNLSINERETLKKLIALYRTRSFRELTTQQLLYLKNNDTLANKFSKLVSSITEDLIQQCSR